MTDYSELKGFLEQLIALDCSKYVMEIDDLQAMIAENEALRNQADNDRERRRSSQAQGVEKAKAEGKYQGRPVNEDLHKRVKELLAAGLGVRPTARHAKCSTTTVLKIRREFCKEASHV